MMATHALSLTLSGYIARRFLAGFFLILCGLISIIFLIEIVELFRRSAGRAEIGLTLVLELAFLKLPQAVQKILPFACLFGGMYAFWRLTRSSELIVARASGISIWQILIPAILSASVLGALAITILNPLGAAMLLRYEKLETSLFKGQSALLAVSDSGVWLRQADSGGQSVIHALGMAPAADSLTGVTVYLFDPEGRFLNRLDAREATLIPGEWWLEDVRIATPDQPSRRIQAYSLATDWTPQRIRDSFSPPETMSFWQLPAFIALLDNAGFAATRHRMHWYGLLAVPLIMAAMVLIAASFSMRMSRSGGVARLIVSGVAFSFLMFFFSDLVFALGLASSIPPALAAGAPALVTILVGLSLLLYSEEG